MSGSEYVGQRQASRRLFVLGAALLLCMLGAIGLVIRELYNDAISDAGRDTANLGVVLAEQTARSIQSIDMILQEIRQRVESNASTSPDAASFASHRLLASYAEQTPQVDAFVFVGADGNVISTSRQYPTSQISAVDRDYFIHLRDHP